MKKVVIFLAVALTNVCANAQKVLFDVHGGLNIASASMSSSMQGEASNSSLAGYKAGVGVAFPINDNIRIKSGIDLTTKGFKQEYSYNSYKSEDKIRPMYVQLPVLVSGGYSFNEKVRLEGNIGAYFAYGIAGKAKFKESNTNWSDEYERDIFGDKGPSWNDESETEATGDMGIKRFDAGLVIGADIILYQHLMFNIQYELGLTNVVDNKVWKEKYNYENPSIKNRSLCISVGYIF